MPSIPYSTAESRRPATVTPPKAAPVAAPRPPSMRNANTRRNQTVTKPPKKSATNGGGKRMRVPVTANTPAKTTPVYAVSPLPLDSTQIEQIDAMRRAANEAILSARSQYDEGVATADLNNQMAAQALRRQTELAARDAAARAGSRGVALSPAVIQRVADGLQAQSDAGFADLAGTRASRLADLTRQLQRANGNFATDMNLADRLAARYGANPRGLMGLG